MLLKSVMLIKTPTAYVRPQRIDIVQHIDTVQSVFQLPLTGSSLHAFI